MENNNKIENTNPEDKKYIDLINTGNFLLAVKEYKEDHNCGLKEAKDYIDRLRGIEPGSQKGGCMGIIVLLLAVSSTVACFMFGI